MAVQWVMIFQVLQRKIQYSLSNPGWITVESGIHIHVHVQLNCVIQTEKVDRSEC